MVNEQSLRRTSFEDGVPIRLADGQAWLLPDHPPYRDDEEHIALLRVIGESEDDHERTRNELALAILLLSRNYTLTPPDYQEILGFPTGDPGLAQMQQTVHAIATKQNRSLRRLTPSKTRAPHVATTRWSLGRLLRLRTHAGTAQSWRSH